MKMKFFWKKGWFKQTSEIYAQNTCIGTLTEKTWSNSATGEINGKKYHFQTQGFLKQNTLIIDGENNSVIGHINYNSWMTRAKVEYAGGTADWKYNNNWNTKWRLTGTNGTQIDFYGHANKGKIECNNQDDLLILTGLYITNYYWQITLAILIAVFIPLWLSAT